MPFEPEFREDEEIIHEINIKITKKHLFYLLLTNKAAYWIGKKKFAIKDDTMAIRLPVVEVDRIVFRRSSIRWCLILGSLLVILGVVGILASGFGAHLAWIAAGILIILVGHKRRIVEISGRGRKFSWMEPIYFGGGINQRINQAFSFIKQWAEKYNITIFEYY